MRLIDFRYGEMEKIRICRTFLVSVRFVDKIEKTGAKPVLCRVYTETSPFGTVLLTPAFWTNPIKKEEMVTVMSEYTILVTGI